MSHAEPTRSSDGPAWDRLRERLASATDPLAVLREDQVARWTAGRPTPAEEYLARFPLLSPDDALGLVVAEVGLRRERGESPQLAEYQAKLPNLAADLAVHFQLLSGAAAPTRDGPAGPSRAATQTGPTPAAPGPRSGPAVPGYDLGGEVGRGGMGVVYQAGDAALARDVAVKVLLDRYPTDGPAARRFLEEARITGRLQHPGIPPVHQVGFLPDGRPFLTMKLIKGSTLADLLAERPDPSADLPRFVSVFEQVCQAVGYAHSLRVIHRDLKPGNVMVGAFGEVQVMDWGLAKALAEGGPPVALGPTDSTLGTEVRSERDPGEATQPGSVLGTPAYMAREQAIGAIDQVDERSDVFGLGAILCAILTGSAPYAAPNGESARQMAAVAALGDAFARLDACGAETGLVELCKRCLAPEKADRPADGGAVARAVAGLRAAADERARRAELERAAAELKAAEHRKRRRVQLALVAAVVVIAAGGAGFAWWQDRLAVARAKEQEFKRGRHTTGLPRR
jgi:hypothetical protein